MPEESRDGTEEKQEGVKGHSRLKHGYTKQIMEDARSLGKSPLQLRSFPFMHTGSQQLHALQVRALFTKTLDPSQIDTIRMPQCLSANPT